MFKQYIRYLSGEPFALVLVDDNKFGYSICCERDHFSKKRAEVIAKGRAKTGINWIGALKQKNESAMMNSKNRIKVKRNGEYIEYSSKLSAVIDKMEYLQKKLKIGGR